jgi:mycothiol synthase
LQSSIFDTIEQGVQMVSSKRESWQVRPASSDDVSVIARLINGHWQALCGEKKIDESEVRSWFFKAGAPQDDTQGWWDSGGELRAYAQVYKGDFPDHWDGYHDITVDPAIGHDAVLWEEVFGWCDRRAQELRVADAARGLCCGARAHEADATKLGELERRGFTRVRVETLMRVSLVGWLAEPQWPAGIAVRALDLKADLEAYAAAHTEAFAEHWGHVEIPLEERIREVRGHFESWAEFLVPETWFAAVDGDEIVGSIGSFPSIGGDPTGSYVYRVFVRPAWRHRGIAAALLRHTFLALRERGCRMAELHVDSENATGALEFYRSVGMRPAWHQWDLERRTPPQ